MTAYNPKKLVQFQVLQSLNPRWLLELLNQFKTYFDLVKFPLPKTLDPDHFDYDGLLYILASRNDNVIAPDELMDALFIIDSLSTKKSMNNLLRGLEDPRIDKNKIQLNTACPADVALQLWFQAPGLLKEVYAKHEVAKAQTFKYYHSFHDGPVNFISPERLDIYQMEQNLSKSFEEFNRGSGCKVMIFEHDHRIMFVIRHGMPLKRKGCVKNDFKTSSIVYRPMQFDVLLFDPETNSIAVRTSTKKERRMYLEAIGHYAFRDKNYFSFEEKYTFDPFFSDGEESLNCHDVDGIDKIILKGIFYTLDSAFFERLSHLTIDYFAMLKSKGKSLPAEFNITKAVFDVTFKNQSKPTRIEIKTVGEIRRYEGNEDHWLEVWLKKRGFYNQQNKAGNKNELQLEFA